MDFNFSEEQQLLADTVQRFVREHYSFEKRRGDPQVRRRLEPRRLAGACRARSHRTQRAGGTRRAWRRTRRHDAGHECAWQGLLLEPFLSAAVIAPALLTRLGGDGGGRVASGDWLGRTHRHRGAPGTADAWRAQCRDSRAEKSGGRLCPRRSQERHRSRRRSRRVADHRAHFSASLTIRAACRSFASTRKRQGSRSRHTARSTDSTLRTLRSRG